ncbi:hypothetical protein [Variovorax sp. PvP013]|uniref:hypothetical protein n=1 Tax=Variovorax sp. PvP013 TaxID=3156435 RepID=UPI003D1A5C83
MSKSAQIKPLPEVLAAENVPTNLIDSVKDSGFYMRGWVDPFSGRTWQSVSDMMYGNKQFSSSFPTEEFIKYINGNYSFPALPPPRSYDVSSVAEIHEVLAEPRRAHHMSEGTFTFRGQPKEYKYKRKIPSPVRAGKDGREISILSGAYRQTDEFYSFARSCPERRSFEWLLAELEPNNPDVFLDSQSAYDIMRTEQHYATQTSGLDLAFGLDTALFFATHRFKFDETDRAYYEAVPNGEHSGVIYCFRFRDPPVKRTQYLIKDFDLFKTYPPLRIIRQECGLPLIMPSERNIALTDVDCIINLTPEFSLPETFQMSREYMFPSVKEDGFYGRLLQLKDKEPDLLQDIVEYKWARD